MAFDSYFERITYTGDRSPTLATLRALHHLHPQAIPFENLNAFAGLPVPLEARSLEQKLIRSHRGGWCFEQNLLFARVLQSLGFQVQALSARVLWNSSTVLPRTHMLLIVRLDGADWIADVGFGSRTLTAPLQLVANVEQATPHEPFRLLHEDGHFKLQACVSGEWRSVYRFDLQEQLQQDYEVTNWYLSNHPQSRFVNNLIAARTEAETRYTLLNNELAVHHPGGATERRLLTSVDEIVSELASTFHIDVPEAPGLHHKLHGLLTRAV